jgi:hypothetical protein
MWMNRWNSPLALLIDVLIIVLVIWFVLWLLGRA